MQTSTSAETRQSSSQLAAWKENSTLLNVTVLPTKCVRQALFSPSCQPLLQGFTVPLLLSDCTSPRLLSATARTYWWPRPFLFIMAAAAAANKWSVGGLEGVATQVVPLRFFSWRASSPRTICVRFVAEPGWTQKVASAKTNEVSLSEHDHCLVLPTCMHISQRIYEPWIAEHVSAVIWSRPGRDIIITNIHYQ